MGLNMEVVFSKIWIQRGVVCAATCEQGVDGVWWECNSAFHEDWS